MPAPKEQPPRKLSGTWTKRWQIRLWKVALDAPADGITFSGKPTEGAPFAHRLVQPHEKVLPCRFRLSQAPAPH